MEHVCCLAVLGFGYFILDRLYDVIETAGNGLMREMYPRHGNVLDLRNGCPLRAAHCRRANAAVSNRRGLGWPGYL